MRTTASLHRESQVHHRCPGEPVEKRSHLPNLSIIHFWGHVFSSATHSIPPGQLLTAFVRQRPTACSLVGVDKRLHFGFTYD